MTDRELLEMAAKAAGILGTWSRGHQPYGDTWIEGLDCGGQFLWNPFVSDGDALRLAVKLQISIDPRGDHVCAISSDDTVAVIENGPTGELISATRRAIVRAAAEIGKATP